MSQLRPFYENVQAHYDVSNEFYQLFLDPTLTYSSALFTRPGMSLEEAQYAKLDSMLDEAKITPGQRVLEVGFGWGSMSRRAAEKYGARMIGLTLSLNQHDFVLRQLEEKPLKQGAVEVRVQGWEEFNEPVDRIVSCEVFEHFRRERYAPFFDRCLEIMPTGGRLVLQTSLHYTWPTLRERNIELSHENVLFGKFIRDVIFPGGELCEPSEVIARAEASGFETTRTASLAEHYPPTLDQWAAALEAKKDEAIALTSQKIYDNYMYYLTGCSKHFRSGHIDVWQFTFEKP